MLFNSFGLVAISAALADAAKLQMLMFNTGQSTLDLGGASTTRTDGVLYRIDNGSWKEIKASDDKGVCSKVCGKGEFSGFDVPELNGNTVKGCQDNFGGPGECTPGGTFTCQFTYGDSTKSFSSVTDVSLYGLGSQVGTYCGGDVADI